MVIARKSAVSTRNTWLEEDSTLPVSYSPSTPTKESRVGSRRKRRTTRGNVLISPLEPKVNNNVSNNQESSTTVTGQSSDRLQIMSPTASLPMWLMRLYAINRCSAIVAFLFVATALVIYGWTVYSQEMWSQAYRRLQSLQRHERQLTTTNATLTSKMADEGEKPEMGLVSPAPQGTIFLPVAPHSPKSPSSPSPGDSESQQPAPLPGY